MILHGVPDADIQNGDVLARPQRKEGGELMRFGRVVSNPPFSQNCNRADLEFPERFLYGFAPETGKKARLMFARHMLASPRKGGMMVILRHRHPRHASREKPKSAKARFARKSERPLVAVWTEVIRNFTDLRAPTVVMPKPVL